MSFTMRSFVLGSPLLFLLSCGGVPKEAPKSSVVVAPVPTQAAPRGPDLSPVAAPADMFLIGRVARPSELASTVARWVQVPFEPKMIDALEPGLSEALALDAPVEFAAVLASGGKPMREPVGIVSFGVASVERAKKLLEAYNGHDLIEKSPSVWVADENTKAPCAIAPSLGKSSARLVCPSSAEGLELLLPYAARGLPLADLGTSDVRIELRAAPLQARFAGAMRMGKVVVVPEILEELGLGDPKFDRPLMDATNAVGDDLLDWFEDLERVQLDLTALGKPESFELKTTVNYKSHKSLMATLTGQAKSTMAPPSPMFFELPADALRAGYVTATDPRTTEKATKLMSNVVDGFLSHLAVAPKLREEVTRGLAEVAASGRGAVFAQVGAKLPAGKAKLTEAERLSAMVGNYVVGIDGPAGPMQAWMRSWAKVYNDRAFRKGIDQLVAQKAGVGASSKTGAAAGKSKSLLELLKIKTKTVKGLPAGSEVLSVAVEVKDADALLGSRRHLGKRAKKGTNVELDKAAFQIALVPDGSRTWMLVSSDESALAGLAKSVMTGSTGPKLGSRPELSPMRGQSAFAAGFFSLETFKGYLAVMLEAAGKPSSGADSLFGSLPHRGTTPAFYRFVATGEDQRPTFEGSVVIPRALFDDVAAAVPTLMMSF